MRRRLRSTRWLAAAVVVGGCAALATILATATPAAVDRVGSASASHSCLVMTGSGDPAFIKNFNPYTATGQPSGAFVQGAFYEPLVITGKVFRSDGKTPVLDQRSRMDVTVSNGGAST